MSERPRIPHGWFGPEDRQSAALVLVEVPKTNPREAEQFPFRLAVLIATTVLAMGALGARYWILPALLAVEEKVLAPVVQVRSAESLEAAKPMGLSRVSRVEAAPPFAPRAVSPVPLPAVQPEELVQAEWERPASEPYDPSDLLEESDLPFPPIKEEPQVAKTAPKKTTPKKSEPKQTRRTSVRPESTPKPAAKGPSRPAREVKRFQPAYPRSARRAGTEGRVVLTVQVRTDGRVGSVRVASSSGSADLDSAAISAVKRWRFSPELKDGRLVTATLNVPFRFALK